MKQAVDVVLVLVRLFITSQFSSGMIIEILTTDLGSHSH